MFNNSANSTIVVSLRLPTQFVNELLNDRSRLEPFYPYTLYISLLDLINHFRGFKGSLLVVVCSLIKDVIVLRFL